MSVCQALFLVLSLPSGAPVLACPLRFCLLPWGMQRVKASLPTQPDNVLVLPFDLCGDYTELEQAAATADAAFGGAGVDYLIHNAGGTNTYCTGIGACYK